VAELIRALLCAWLALACPSGEGSQIPAAAWEHQRLLVRSVLAEWGRYDYVSVLAAQVHQESGWRGDVCSPFACGWTQFTESTAKWFGESIGKDLGPPVVFDVRWAIPAMARYDRWLYDRVSGLTVCDRSAKWLSAYNGGLAWISRDEQLAAANGADPGLWWGHVERYSKRAAWAIQENRGYPRRILKILTPRYLQAGWFGVNVCEGYRDELN
jgi:membrane-bound lytic murein transglycosylase MltF